MGLEICKITDPVKRARIQRMVNDYLGAGGTSPAEPTLPTARPLSPLYEDHHKASHPEPQCPVSHEPVAAKAGETVHPTRLLVSVVCFRTRLTDPDNLCPKYFIDCLRYAEIIPDDTQADIELVVRQEKVKHKIDERTELEVNPIVL